MLATEATVRLTWKLAYFFYPILLLSPPPTNMESKNIS
jgi:hypothetical protein